MIRNYFLLNLLLIVIIGVLGSKLYHVVKYKAAEKPPLPSPPKLYGTVILNNNKTAILEQSDTRTTKVYRINDTISGYTVLEIHEDKVVLSGNDEKVEVRLR